MLHECYNEMKSSLLHVMLSKGPSLNTLLGFICARYVKIILATMHFHSQWPNWPKHNALGFSTSWLIALDSVNAGSGGSEVRGQAPWGICVGWALARSPLHKLSPSPPPPQSSSVSSPALWHRPVDAEYMPLTLQATLGGVTHFSLCLY